MQYSLFFNGGVLKAGANNVSFLPACDAASSSNVVQAGGARIDDGGYAITVGASLVHDPGLAGTDGGFTKLGGGSLTFLAPQTYTGPTLIHAGTLKLACSAACGTIANSAHLCIGAGTFFDASASARCCCSRAAMARPKVPITC